MLVDWLIVGGILLIGVVFLICAKINSNNLRKKEHKEQEEAYLARAKYETERVSETTSTVVTAPGVSASSCKSKGCACSTNKPAKHKASLYQVPRREPIRDSHEDTGISAGAVIGAGLAGVAAGAALASVFDTSSEEPSSSSLFSGGGGEFGGGGSSSSYVDSSPSTYESSSNDYSGSNDSSSADVGSSDW